MAFPVREAGGVRPFELGQVTLGDSVFREKRDRLLYFAREYGPSVVGGVRDDRRGPDRMLRSFRVNAGLDHRGASPIGSWETPDGNLRGHYTGHFLTLLAQSYASTGERIFKDKLDYLVTALGECQDALAAAARKPTPRVAGRSGTAIRLTGTPNGHITGDADHIAAARRSHERADRLHRRHLGRPRGPGRGRADLRLRQAGGQRRRLDGPDVPHRTHLDRWPAVRDHHQRRRRRAARRRHRRS